MRQRALDVAPAVLLGALGLAQIAGLNAGDEFAGPAWLDAIALVCCVVPLVARRRWPGAVLLAVVVVNLLWTQVLFAPTDEVVLETWFSLLVAIWAVAVHGRSGEVPVVVLAVVVELTQAVLEHVRGVPPSQQAVPAVSFVAAAAAGWAVRHHRRTATLLQQRTVELARERDARVAEAAELERSRIARELHDLVTHSLSVVVLHAAAERERVDPGDAAYGALATVEQASRTALSDLRRLVGLLRADPAGLEPQPTLAELGSLLPSARAGGVRVSLSVADRLDDLDPALQLTAYRIIQEALTNAMKHGAPCAARVTVARRPGTLEVSVVDDGRSRRGSSAAFPGAGHGLVGMRERVRLFGGTLEAGPLPEGGFSVVAVLPLAEVPTCPAAS